MIHTSRSVSVIDLTTALNSANIPIRFIQERIDRVSVQPMNPDHTQQILQIISQLPIVTKMNHGQFIQELDTASNVPQLISLLKTYFGKR